MESEYCFVTFDFQQQEHSPNLPGYRDLRSNMETEPPTREHKCPWCFQKREAPMSVLVHPRETYTATCECGKPYTYNYDLQSVHKGRRKRGK